MTEAITKQLHLSDFLEKKDYIQPQSAVKIPDSEIKLKDGVYYYERRGTLFCVQCRFAINDNWDKHKQHWRCQCGDVNAKGEICSFCNLEEDLVRHSENYETTGEIDD